jgi:ribosome-binding factor A
MDGGIVVDRQNRIAGEMRKEIADIIRNSIKDPRIPDLVSVIAVRVTKDLSYAKVYISVFGSEDEKNDAMTALKNASGFVRREIGQRIKLRYTPEILFLPDDSIEQGIYINNLINETLYPEKKPDK